MYMYRRVYGCPYVAILMALMDVYRAITRNRVGDLHIHYHKQAWKLLNVTIIIHRTGGPYSHHNRLEYRSLYRHYARQAVGFCITTITGRHEYLHTAIIVTPYEGFYTYIISSLY
jgi:hypothetical protein